MISPAITPHILCTQNKQTWFPTFLTYPSVFHNTDCWIRFSALLPTHFMSLCGPTKTVHWDPFALPFTSVWSCQVSTSRSLGSIDRIHMWWLFRGNWWRTKSRLYVGMKGNFLNKWKIKLWTALELCLFLNFKICWYALNCSCRSLSFCCWKITNVFLKLLHSSAVNAEMSYM